MSKARAAKIWAQLERFLIERCGLPDGRMLDRDRPQLIRSIGNALGGGEFLDEEEAQRQSQAQRKAPRQGQGEGRIRPMATEGAEPVTALLSPIDRRTAAPQKKVTVKLRERWRDNKHFDGTAQARWPDTVHDPVLAAMLERSCSRRMGYDGDDEVGYASR